MQDKLIEAAEAAQGRISALDSYGTFLQKIVCADESGLTYEYNWGMAHGSKIGFLEQKPSPPSAPTMRGRMRG